MQLESEVGVLSLVAAWLELTDLGGGYWSNNDGDSASCEMMLVKVPCVHGVGSLAS